MVQEGIWQPPSLRFSHLNTAEHKHTHRLKHPAVPAATLMSSFILLCTNVILCQPPSLPLLFLPLWSPPTLLSTHLSHPACFYSFTFASLQPAFPFPPVCIPLTFTLSAAHCIQLTLTPPTPHPILRLAQILHISPQYLPLSCLVSLSFLLPSLCLGIL